MTSSSTGRARREFGLTALAIAAAAGMMLASGGQVWAQALLEAPGPVPSVPVEATGADLTGVPSGIGWAGLAGIAGLYAARGRARRIIGAAVAAGGLFVLVAVWTSTRTEALTDAVATRATDVAGTAQLVGEPETQTIGPLVAVAGAALLVLAGVVATVRAPAWPGMSNRYDRVAVPRPSQAVTQSDLWKSLDAGDDPTLGAPDGDGVPAEDAGSAADTGSDTASVQPATGPERTKEGPDGR
ncbi:Trp biosynthesis-associated membrane protein [Nocardiopsis xinjiangensis]|uniref:Trp biosynthesis-associated membrane protein n=1 Tax=Nocardiopsis xinjiangensis TaxID=124285 RepID=UPI000346B9F0|nr:Trp biosynthesis-associated membrane protein [Nocardiopsis xinjiangensis]